MISLKTPDGDPHIRISPLRYPGGKGALTGYLRRLIRSNGLAGGTYVEPYAGGAGAGLNLLVTGQVERVVINDLDPAIHAFWRTVVEAPTLLIKRIHSVPLTVEEWRRQRETYLRAGREDFEELGFATFYLNRTNRSGVLNGGIIGGVNQTGNYKIDARFNRTALAERIRVLSLYARKIEVLSRDGVDVLAEYATCPKTFIYADPPYFEKAGSLYLNAFRPHDHQKLADTLNRLAGTNWLLTYDNVPDVERLYAERRRSLYTIGYSAYRVTKAKEVAVFSDTLLLQNES